MKGNIDLVGKRDSVKTLSIKVMAESFFKKEPVFAQNLMRRILLAAAFAAVGTLALFAGHYLPHYMPQGTSEFLLVILYSVSRHLSFFLAIAPAVFLRKSYFIIVVITAFFYAAFTSGDYVAAVSVAKEEYMSFPDGFFTKEMMSNSI